MTYWERKTSECYIDIVYSRCVVYSRLGTSPFSVAYFLSILQDYMNFENQGGGGGGGGA